MQMEIKQCTVVYPAVLSKWFMSRQNPLWRTHFLGLRWQSNTNHLSNASAYCNGFLIRDCAFMITDLPSSSSLLSLHPFNCSGWACRVLEKLCKTFSVHVFCKPLTKQGIPGPAMYVQIVSDGLKLLHWSLGTCSTVAGLGGTVIHLSVLWGWYLASVQCGCLGWWLDTEDLFISLLCNTS